MAIKIYEYAGCSTCKNALKYLDARKKKYEKVPIVEQPPTVSELEALLGYYKLGRNGREAAPRPGARLTTRSRLGPCDGPSSPGTPPS